jgi:hypothetical protein
MPREVIHSSNPDQPFRLSVGWTKDLNAQLGIQVDDSERTMADLMFADHTEALGAKLEEFLVESGVMEAPDYKTSDAEAQQRQVWGGSVLSWLSQVRDYVERDGVWIDLNRTQLNDLVRHARTARDGAYGKDQ